MANGLSRNAKRILTAALLGAAVFAAVPSLLLLTPPTSAHAQKAPTREQLATGTWDVDKAHTDIGFTVVHMGVSKVRGHFDDFDGQVIADGKNPAKSSVSVSIKVASISTGQTARDTHLKSADFFDADKYPEITFKSESVRKSGKGFIARGPLTIHGVTKIVELPFTVSGPLTGPGGLRAGVDTSIRISRKAFGLTWNKLVEGTSMVSDDVDIAISLEMLKKGTTTASK